MGVQQGVDLVLVGEGVLVIVEMLVVLQMMFQFVGGIMILVLDQVKLFSCIEVEGCVVVGFQMLFVVVDEFEECQGVILEMLVLEWVDDEGKVIKIQV